MTQTVIKLMTINLKLNPKMVKKKRKINPRHKVKIVAKKKEKKKAKKKMPTLRLRKLMKNY